MDKFATMALMLAARSPMAGTYRLAPSTIPVRKQYFGQNMVAYRDDCTVIGGSDRPAQGLWEISAFQLSASAATGSPGPSRLKRNGRSNA